MREQVCKYMCPYARFQSAMFDKDTLIISYDKPSAATRGAVAFAKDRPPRRRGWATASTAALCVQVCPTGIDIRNGPAVRMHRLRRLHRRLRRRDGQDAVPARAGALRHPERARRSTFTQAPDAGAACLRPRVHRLFLDPAAHPVSAPGWSAWRLRSHVQASTWCATALRWRASSTNGRVENLYRLQIMNAAEEPASATACSVEGPRLASCWPSKDEVSVGTGRGALDHAVEPWCRPKAAAEGRCAGAHPIRFRIERLPTGDQAGAAASIEEKSTFVVPR